MKRVFGLVGYACNGKSTIINKIVDKSEFKFIDLPQIYKNEAYKNGFDGVTPWYLGVGLEKYREESRKAVFKFIDEEISKNDNLIIDDVFDIEVYKRLIEIFPQMELISFHSRYNDRLKRLSKRAGLTQKEELISGLKARDNMKRYCGIEDVLTHCKYHINNKKDINSAKLLLDNKLNRNLIICIVGYSGCGKSSICNLLSKNFDIPLFKYGKEANKFVKKAGYNKSRDFVKSQGMEQYENFINSNMYNVLNEYMTNNKVFLIDGIISCEVYDWLKENNEMFTIYIKLDEEERLNRLIEREKIPFDKAKEELYIKDNIKIECGLDMVVAKCNCIVESNQELDLIVDKVSKLISSFGLDKS